MRLLLALAASLLAVAPAAAQTSTCLSVKFDASEAPAVQAMAPASGMAPRQASPSKTGAPQEAELLGISWRLRAEGTLVTGQLEARLAGPQAEASAELAIFPAAGLRILEVEMLAGAESIRLERQKEAPQRATAGARQGARPRAEAVRGELYPMTVPVMPEFVLRFTVETEAPLGSGAFRLDLAAVSAGCGAGEAKPAEGGPAMSMDWTLRVPGGAEEDLRIVESSMPVTISDDDRDAILSLVDGSVPAQALSVAWALAADDETSGRAWSRERSDGSREVSVVVVAPARPDERAVRARDVTFVLDRSGSMGAAGKLDFARKALASCLATLRDRDAFNVLAFSDKVQAALEAPGSGEEARLSVASFLADMAPQGGTRLAPALEQALLQQRENPGHRMIVVLSDGIVGDEKAVLDLLADPAFDARLLLVSVGSDARKDTLRRMAETGRGEAITVAEPSAIGQAMASLFESFASPVAWDLDVDWDGADVKDVRPARIPDLHAGRPVTLRATVEGRPPTRVRVRGATADGPDRLDLLIAVDDAEP